MMNDRTSECTMGKTTGRMSDCTMGMTTGRTSERTSWANLTEPAPESLGRMVVYTSQGTLVMMTGRMFEQTWENWT